MNHHVYRHTCVSCPVGTHNVGSDGTAVRDAAPGVDTACAAKPAAPTTPSPVTQNTTAAARAVLRPDTKRGGYHGGIDALSIAIALCAIGGVGLAGAKIAKQLLAPRASRLSRYKRSDRSERQALLIPL